MCHCREEWSKKQKPVGKQFLTGFFIPKSYMEIRLKDNTSPPLESLSRFYFGRCPKGGVVTIVLLTQNVNDGLVERNYA